MIHSFGASIPVEERVGGLRSLIFRLGSRAGGSVHQLHVAPKSGYPYKLFGCLGKRDELKAFENESDCIKDPFTIYLEKTFGGLDNDLCYQTILHHL